MQQTEDESRTYPVTENMRWQRIEWRIQYVGYVLLFLVVILGAAGLFSKGILSEGVQVSPDGKLRVEYERFGLRDSNMNMNIRLSPLRGSQFTLTISGSEMDNFQIQTLQPQPIKATSRDNNLVLAYAVNTQDAGATLWLGIQPQTFGRYPVTVTLNHASSVHFTQWIYP